jgi:hypothetical protein
MTLTKNPQSIAPPNLKDLPGVMKELGIVPRKELDGKELMTAARQLFGMAKKRKICDDGTHGHVDRASFYGVLALSLGLKEDAAYVLGTIRNNPIYSKSNTISSPQVTATDQAAIIFRLTLSPFKSTSPAYRKGIRDRIQDAIPQQGALSIEYMSLLAGLEAFLCGDENSAQRAYELAQTHNYNAGFEGPLLGILACSLGKMDEAEAIWENKVKPVVDKLLADPDYDFSFERNHDPRELDDAILAGIFITLLAGKDIKDVAL